MEGPFNIHFILIQLSLCVSSLFHDYVSPIGALEHLECHEDAIMHLKELVKNC